jgi:flavin-dependent dehydrogenase
VVTSHVRSLVGPDVSAALRSEITRYELFADGRVAHVSLGEPDVVIDRVGILRALEARVKDAGVRVEYGRRFVDLERDGDGLLVKFDEAGRVRSERVSAVIGADGAASDVAQRVGRPKLATVPVVQAIVRRPDDVGPTVARVWFRPQDTPYFYWLIPDGPDDAAVGLIGDDPATARAHLDAFLADKALVPLSYQAARIPAYERWMSPHSAVGGGDVYLVGDAAGHVKVSTVGGIHTGFVGAEAVADMITTGSTKGLRALRRDLDRHRLIRRALHPFDTDDYRRLLGLLGEGPKSLLARHTRDDSRRLLWRLAVREPRLVLLAVRGLLTGQPSAGTRRNNATRKPPTATTQPMSM